MSVSRLQGNTDPSVAESRPLAILPGLQVRMEVVGHRSPIVCNFDPFTSPCDPGVAGWRLSTLIGLGLCRRPAGVVLPRSRYRDIVADISMSVDPELGPKPTKVPIAFPEDLYEWLREQAYRRRTSMAHLVREAVAEYRLRSEPQLELPIGGGRA